MKKRSNNEFIIFKYFTNDGKRDDEESKILNRMKKVKIIKQKISY
jgi:hypothetical protein